MKQVIDASAHASQIQSRTQQPASVFAPQRVSYEDFINARSPYQYRIIYEGFRPMGFGRYVPFLRRTMKSLNKKLIRIAGFPFREGSVFDNKLIMIEGMIILHGHGSKPLVEIVCNVNQQYCFITPQALTDAFRSSHCYESRQHRVPLLDYGSLDVSFMHSKTWDAKYLQEEPYILSLVGGRCIMEF